MAEFHASYNGTAENFQSQMPSVSRDSRTQRPDVRPKERTSNRNNRRAIASSFSLETPEVVFTNSHTSEWTVSNLMTAETSNRFKAHPMRCKHQSSSISQPSSGTSDVSASAPQTPYLKHTKRLVREHKCLLESVIIHSSLMTSSSVKAVQINLKDYSLSRERELILTALRICLVRYMRPPKASELLECIIDADFDEDTLVTEFIVFCDSFGDIDNIPFFKEGRKTPRGGAEKQNERIVEGVNEVAAERQSSDEFVPSKSASNTSLEPKSQIQRSLDSIQFEVPASLMAGSNHLQSGFITSTPQSYSDDFIFEARNQHTSAINTGSNDTIFYDQKHATETCNTRLEETKPSLPEKKDPRREWTEKLMKILKREQSYLKERTTCIVCKSKNVEVTFLPCSHLITCTECSSKCSRCPICDRKVLADATTFMV